MEGAVWRKWPVPEFCIRIPAAAGLVFSSSPSALLLYIVLTLLSGMIPVLTAWFTKTALDSLVSAAPWHVLIGYALALATVGLLGGLVPHALRYLRNNLVREVPLFSRARLFSAVNKFIGIARFEEPEYLDRLRLAQQPGVNSPLDVVDGALSAIRDSVTSVGFLASLAILDPILPGLVIASGVPVLVGQISLSKRRAKMMSEVGSIERREFFYGQLLSGIEAAKEVRLFDAGGFLRRRMLDERRNANKRKKVVDRYELKLEVAIGSLTAFIAGGGVLWAVQAAHSGAVSVGGVTMFVAALAGVQGALAALAGDLAKINESLLMFAHYRSVLDSVDDMPVAASPMPLPVLSKGITLRNIWFRYSEDHEWILRGLDLFIPAGASIALVGLNGAGKSTVVKLLCRFYDPDKGSILWDGVDIRDVDARELRQAIGAVFQDFMKYDMTAAENISLGDINVVADEDRIRRAATRAGIHNHLTKLPHGYETLLSRTFFMESDKDNPDTGVVPSGGQWQRLALARAFFREGRDLLILDEPASGLDAAAESEIHRSLQHHRQNRTTILISHRLGAVRDADRIAVIRGGKLNEYGDHQTLMKLKGEYARLFNLQAEGYRSEKRTLSSEIGI
ncbi:ABC transporter ATP-binding protein [Streptomyces sp. N2A]|uniref:ABC transporter ATP-binding protein n=1 Tax=Streptomyces sp. N2A TaxID=3073936 RepID=UPI00287041CC|nr:ABC transporter ATP-binding protein [Streptomyces sp. N2A]